MQEPLTLRNETRNEDMTARQVNVRAETIDEAQRSVEALIATDQIVTVYDMRTWQIIDEV